MILAHVGPLLVGQVVGKDIRSMAPRAAFVRAGTRLTELHVNGLLRLGVDKVYIVDPFFPELDIEPVLNPATLDGTRAAVEETMSRIADGKGSPDWFHVRESVRLMIDDLARWQDTSFNLTVLRQISDYTFVHSVNVATIALAMGQKLGLNRVELEYLGTGALMHDVGKATLPASLLNKPGKLSDLEWAEMQTHCETGYRWLRKFFHSIPYPSARCALEHHERLDGSGYPRGLKGDQILLISRIVAVADVYDAMTADRVYRAGRSTPETLSFLGNEAGTRLDGDAVDALMQTAAHYPEGSVVVLASDLIARVVQQTTDPASPLVAIVSDAQRRLESSGPNLVKAQGEHRIVSVLPGYPPELLQEVGLDGEDG